MRFEPVCVAFLNHVRVGMEFDEYATDRMSRNLNTYRSNVDQSESLRYRFGQIMGDYVQITLFIFGFIG